MDLLDRERLVADTVFHRLARRSTFELEDGRKAYVEECFIPLIGSKSRHVYVPFDSGTRIHFTRSQLQKLHRQFFYPSASKLFNLLQKARPEDATPETLKILKDISRRCDPCKRIQPAPVRFRVYFGTENVRFNERIMMDIMYIDSMPVLHILDESTRFSAVRFLPSVSTTDIWDALLRCWASIYTGLPNRILVDQGRNLGRSEPFISLAARSNVEVQGTDTESHSSLGIGERYHEPVRSTFMKMRISYPNIDKKLLLHLTVNSMNDTLGPEGLVPSSLVFGELPRVYTPSDTPKSRDTLLERAEMFHTARSEMQRIMAKMRVARGLKHAVPPFSDQAYDPGDQVLVWREKIVNNRIGEWLGPFTVLSMDSAKKLIYVQDVKVGSARPFNFAQVKRYLAPEDVSHSLLSDIHLAFENFSSADDDDYSCHLTKIIDPTDPRATSTEMSKAKCEEIRGLRDRGTFNINLRENVPLNGNVLPGRFVLAIKSTEDRTIKFKARHVLGGHRDRMKDLMVHNAATLQSQSIRLFLAILAMHCFDIWTSDVQQAYMQSAEPLLRDLFITKPVPEFELKPEQCLKLLKPLYGLCDSGDLWYKIFDEHHRHDLGMLQFRSDPALYKITKDDQLLGLS